MKQSRDEAPNKCSYINKWKTRFKYPPKKKTKKKQHQHTQTTEQNKQKTPTTSKIAHHNPKSPTGGVWRCPQKAQRPVKMTVIALGVWSGYISQERKKHPCGVNGARWGFKVCLCPGLTNCEHGQGLLISSAWACGVLECWQQQNTCQPNPSLTLALWPSLIQSALLSSFNKKGKTTTKKQNKQKDATTTRVAMSENTNQQILGQNMHNYVSVMLSQHSGH